MLKLLPLFLFFSKVFENVNAVNAGSSDGYYIKFCPAKDSATVITLITLHFPVWKKGKECSAE
jgi:hypothetical protein